MIGNTIKQKAARALRAGTNMPRASTFARAGAAAKTAARHSFIKANVIGAATGAGVAAIKYAEKKLNKQIDSQTSKSGMDDHQRMLDRAQARKAAAAKLRKSKQPKAVQGMPGGPWTPGYDVTKWD